MEASQACTDVENIYQQTKLLLIEKQGMEAKQLLWQKREFIMSNWKELVTLSMMKHNCPVTKLFLKEFGRLGKKSEHFNFNEFLDFVVNIDRRVEKAFMENLNAYVNSPEYAKIVDKYTDTRVGALTVMKANYGFNLHSTRDIALKTNSF